MSGILETIDERTQDGFDIKCYALEEDDSPQGHFASGDDKADAQVLKDIADGALQWFCVKVTACKAGVKLAETYLGGCCYAEFKDFVKNDDYYKDMRAEVVTEARETIKKLSAKPRVSTELTDAIGIVREVKGEVKPETAAKRGWTKLSLVFRDEAGNVTEKVALA